MWNDTFVLEYKVRFIVARAGCERMISTVITWENL